ncbi:hypothetical protein G7Y89_g7032 [Cudoniella acicularis]|uniref:Uncharacterized protein n=1 Tax=Cudoniella acicularis TaxID=354080 RepID=A0A8H4W2B7_9HELO|nr:hypothetical protein G7Y89_g7032 [Cudoniella acicularis]
MKSSIFFLFPLLPSVLASKIEAVTDINHPSKALFNPYHPIYLGEVFWPPSMTFIAWLPTAQNTLTEWCWKAIEADPQTLYSLGGIDALETYEYFGEQAYITREGKRWADCRITPESERMGACTGVADWDCEGKHKFTGPGTRKWSCWVIDKERAVREWEGKLKSLENRNGTKDGAKKEEGETVTDAMFTAECGDYWGHG